MSVRHRKKFQDGRVTPQEYHAKHAFPPGAKCSGCGRPPSIRAIVMAPLDEVRKRDPDFGVVADLALTNPQAAKRFHEVLVPLRGSDGRPVPHIRLSTALACPVCAPAMEKALAKGPSWCVVDIQRGPGPDKLVTSG